MRWKSLLGLVLASIPASCVALGQGMGEGIAPAEVAALVTGLTEPTSYEYKYHLSGADGIDLKELRKRLVAALSPLSRARISGWDRKKCRLIQFYDTKDRSLRDAGFLLRVRRKMDKKSCAHATKMTTLDVVLKWRGTDA